MGELAQLTDQVLVAQLAHIEDVIGVTPTFLPAAEGPELLNGVLLDLLTQEVNILDELRIRLASLGAAAGVAHHRAHPAWGSGMERMYVRPTAPATGES